MESGGSSKQGEIIEEALCKSAMENARSKQGEAKLCKSVIENGGSSKQGEPIEEGKVLSVKCLAKRLHAREAESDESFTKRSRTMEERVLNVSKVVLRVGPNALAYKFHSEVVNLATHSVKLREIIESTFEEDGKGCIIDENGRSVAVIDLPDFECDADILRIVVEDFCLRGGVMEENVISISNVQRLLNAAEFLQIEGLLCAIRKFLEKNCLDFLATFDCIDVLSSDSDLNNTQGSWPKNCLDAITALSAKNLLMVTEVLDYDRLGDDNVEELFTELTLSLGCDPGLLKLFVEIQARKQKKKDEEEFMKLRNKIDLQALDIEDLDKIRVKLWNELRLRTAELTQARMEKER